MKYLVVLPTYNEKDNIREVVERILGLKERIGVVIVDDNSPDGTGQIADKLAQSYLARVEVVHRQGRRGRGLAGVEGFKYALAKGADYILEMDADLSHQPEDIPLLLDKIKDYDVVIGSRYVFTTEFQRGGIPDVRIESKPYESGHCQPAARQCGVQKGRPQERSIFRRWISSLAGLYIRLVLGLKVKDPTSGFRCFRREVLANIDLDTLSSVGPSIVEEILYRCSQKGYFLTEAPIHFDKRQAGKSKLTVKILLSCLILPIRWRIKQL